MAPVRAVTASDVLLLAAGLGFVLVILRTLSNRRSKGAIVTPLRGPPSMHWLFGCSRHIIQSTDVAAIYEEWMGSYGAVFQVPTFMGGRKIVLCDPKAITHFYMNETTTYVQTRLTKIFLEKFFGNGLLSAEGEDHRRQRKALTPAFSIAAIRRLTSVFFDSAYKAKSAWDTVIESAPKNEAVIDVQGWMNRIALDSIGIAGFSHDFHSLDGQSNAIADLFDNLGSRNPGLGSMLLFLFSSILPILQDVPTTRSKALKRLRTTISDIASEMLERTRIEEKGVTSSTRAEEKSIIGLLIKAENEKSELRMTQEEVMAQVRFDRVLVAAEIPDELFSMDEFVDPGRLRDHIHLTWALLELCRKPEFQTKLREELLEKFGNTDPTLDQLTNSLPYLDAVVHETLRTHPPLPETNRVCLKDDIVPLSTPITTSTGEAVTNIIIPKGYTVTAPISFVNKGEAFWGPDAKEFKPERWLDEKVNLDKNLRKNEIQGYRHLLTFSDGPRICLGKSFALAEFKSVLLVLIRHFEFSFPGGTEPTIVRHSGILPRPKVEGETGPKLPLLVKRID